MVLGLLPQSKLTAWSHGWHCSGVPRAALTPPCPGLDLPIFWLSPLQGVPGLMVGICSSTAEPALIPVFRLAKVVFTYL